MDVSINDVMVWLSGLAVTGYVKLVHGKQSKTDERLNLIPEKFVAKDDYRDDMREMKDMLAEMRGDIKSILGVPPQ